MKLNVKSIALIRSLNDTAEVTIIEMVGNNKFLANYQGHVCAAMFNPFQGMYYVDDIQGKFPAMTQEELDNAVYELSYASRCSERELLVYKNLGSIKYLKRLKEQDVKRKKNWERFKRITKAAAIVAGTFLFVLIFVSGVIVLST